MKRRNFLIQSGIFSATAITAISSNAIVARSANPNSDQKRLIVIFLRGAVDGLNVVVPYSETAYYQARPQIAIPQPGKEGQGGFIQRKKKLCAVGSRGHVVLEE